MRAAQSRFSAARADSSFRSWREADFSISAELGFTVLLVGTTNDLSQARAERAKVAKRGATHVFTRLNVARAVRRAEHENLVAGYKPALVSEGA